MIITKLLRDERGAAAVEMALALPVLVTFIYGIFQMGLVFQANAGVQHALGEAAREATIFPAPSDEDLAKIVYAKKFGTHSGTLKETKVVTNGTAGVPDGTRTITLTYDQPTDFLFFQGPTVELVKSKTLYTAVTPDATGSVTCAINDSGDMTCS